MTPRVLHNLAFCPEDSPATELGIFLATATRWDSGDSFSAAAPRTLHPLGRVAAQERKTKRKGQAGAGALDLGTPMPCPAIAKGRWQRKGQR